MLRRVYIPICGLTILVLSLGFTGCGGKPPRMQGRPIGPSDGPINVRQTFYVTAVDPDGQDIVYRFDWGDGIISKWSKPSPSGVIASDTHTFTTEGEKLIKAQAKDTDGKLSEWSEAKIFFATRDEASIRRRFVETDEDGDSAEFISTPAINDDGTIYVGCSFGHLHAIDSTGMPIAKYSHPEEAEFISSPAIGPDGTIYVGSEDGLYAFNPNLSVRWRFPTGGEVISSPAIGADGTIYVLSDDGNLYAISSLGQELWRAATTGGHSSPAIGLDSSVYFGSDNGFLFCYRNNGTQKWSFNAGSPINTSPALDREGRIYFGTEERGVFCLDSTGNQLWRFPTANTSSPVLDDNGNIYFGTENGNLISLSPSGGERWVFSRAGRNVSTPAVRSDGVIYCRMSFDECDSLFAVNADGSRRWAVAIGASEADEPIPSPTIADNGTVFIGGGNALYGLVGAGGGPANSPWPMFRANRKHTGRLQ
ncbi:MAG: PQQ-binding-like beta-propeller repeat protein [candidate division WOR-3 bacterium]